VDEFEGPRYQRISHIKKLLAEGILDAELRHAQPQLATGRNQRFCEPVSDEGARSA
jgi:hypothetical protein